MIDLDDITQEISHGSFTNDQLESIIRAVRYRRSEIGREVRRSVRVGDMVQFYHPGLAQTLKGSVKEVLVKNVMVTTQGRIYRVPASLLELA